MPGFTQNASGTLKRGISSRMMLNMIGLSMPSRADRHLHLVPRGPFSRSATSVVVRPSVFLSLTSRITSPGRRPAL